MAKRPTIATISSGYASTTTLNNNFEELRDGFDNTLSLDGSTPNAMLADLDLNGNVLANAGGILVNGVDILAAVDAAKVSAQASAAASQVSATSSQTSATTAQATLDLLESIYLGAQATDPTLDLNGNPVTLGDWYFNTTDDAVKVFNGTVFVTGSTDPAVITSEALALAIALG